MAFKSVAVAWLSGGALLVGYAGFAWLRSQRTPRRAHRYATDANPEDVEPLSQRLERVPEELALDFDADFEPPANSNGRRQRTDLGALFISRATEAFSPFHAGLEASPATPRVPR